MPIICDLYCRVSTQEQAENGYSIGEQEERLRKYAEAQGWLIHECYADGGFSGSNLNRAGIQAVIKDCQTKKVSKVVVYKLDRLSRRQKDVLYLIEDVFLPNGVDFVSMSESLDTGTPFGMAMIGILSVFAQLEREQIKERMSMGKTAAIKQGNWRGGATVPYAFNYDATARNIVVDEFKAHIVNEIYDMYNAGATLHRIAMDMDAKYPAEHHFHIAMLKRILSNRIYLGFQKWHDEEYRLEGIPCIVSEEKFNRAQEITARKARKTRPMSPYGQKSLLGGIIWCKECGARMSRVSAHKSDAYKCINQLKKYTNENRAVCNSRQIVCSKVDDAVIAELRKIAYEDDTIVQIQHKEANKAALNAKLKDIDSQVKKLIELYSVGGIDISLINERVNALNTEKASIQAELEKDSSVQVLTKNEAVSALHQFSEIVDSVQDKLELSGIIRTLVSSVVVDQETVEIHWNF